MTNANQNQKKHEELESFLKSVNHDVQRESNLPTIPGFDSYVPTYASGGTDRQVIHGQLERDTGGNQ